jgi:hypothetical protein
VLDSTPREHPPARRTHPHERPKPVLHLHGALRARSVLAGKPLQGDPLCGSRARGGDLRGGVRIRAAAPQTRGGLLDLRPCRAPGPGPRPAWRLRSSSHRPGFPRSFRSPSQDDAFNGPGQRCRRRHDARLEGQRSCSGCRSRRRSWSPRPRPAGPHLCPHPPGSPVVTRRYRGAHPGAGPRRSGRRRGLRAPVSGIEKAREGRLLGVTVREANPRFHHERTMSLH